MFQQHYKSNSIVDINNIPLQQSIKQAPDKEKSTLF